MMPSYPGPLPQLANQTSGASIWGCGHQYAVVTQLYLSIHHHIKVAEQQKTNECYQTWGNKRVSTCCQNDNNMGIRRYTESEDSQNLSTRRYLCSLYLCFLFLLPSRVIHAPLLSGFQNLHINCTLQPLFTNSFFVNGLSCDLLVFFFLFAPISFHAFIVTFSPVLHLEFTEHLECHSRGMISPEADASQTSTCQLPARS